MHGLMREGRCADYGYVSEPPSTRKRRPTDMPCLLSVSPALYSTQPGCDPNRDARARCWRRSSNVIRFVVKGVRIAFVALGCFAASLSAAELSL